MEENNNKNLDNNNQKKKFNARRFSKQDMDLITTEIDNKLHDFMKSGKYKDVLLAMGNLGRYSLNNQLYILMQNPNAVTVNGMRKWNSLGRSVKPGEKSIKIFSPIIKYEKEEVLDADGNVVLDENGNPKQIRKKVLKGFEQGYVFDISQTTGKELEAFRMDETRTVEKKAEILEGLKNVVAKKDYTISYADDGELEEGVYGYCKPKDKVIKIRRGMSDLQEISTTVHECGHALAHTEPRKDFEGLTPMEKKEIKEVEAESISCVVCTYLGLDTQNFNFSYIAGWSDGDIKKFKENLSTISTHANSLIQGIEDVMFSDADANKDDMEKNDSAREEDTPFAMVPPSGQGQRKEMEMT